MTILEQTRKSIKTEFPDLHKSSNNPLLNFKDRLFSLGFKKILLLYFLLLPLPILYVTFDFEFFDLVIIDFSEYIKILTPSVITMVSMNLFVTNLLLTHLKDERDELEKIINKKVRFKFITNYGFSIVITLLILYFSSKSYESYRSNILLFIFYSFLIYILLLVDLYRIVFDFINKTTRKTIIVKALEDEFNINLYSKKMKKEFNLNLENFFESVNFKKTSATLYAFNSHLHGKENQFIRFSESKYFRDIKVKKLKKIIGKEQGNYAAFQLDEKIPLENDLLLISSDVKLKSIEKQFIFKKKPLFEVNTDFTVLNIVLNKIDSSVIANRRDLLAEELDSLDSVLDNFLKTY